MAKLHQSTSEYYRIRGYKSLLDRCIQNKIFLKPFQYNFDPTKYTSIFTQNPETFEEENEKRTLDLESNLLEKMISEKKIYMSKMSILAKERFDLRETIKSSCNESTFKDATFFLSGLYGNLANNVDKIWTAPQV